MKNSAAQEPEIIINGTKLSIGEAMTIRFALEMYSMQLNEEGLGDDEHGKKMAEAYLRNIRSIRMKY